MLHIIAVTAALLDNRETILRAASQSPLFVLLLLGIIGVVEYASDW